MTRARLEAAALAALIVGGAFLERQKNGVEPAYLGFVLVLTGTLFRRVLVLRGALEPAPWSLSLLELLAFSGLAVYPIGAWAHELAGAATAAIGLGWVRSRAARRATALEEGGVLSLGVLALALTARNPTAPALGVLALACVEAWRPGAPRTAEDAARRAARFALASALAVTRGLDHGAPDLLLGLAVASVLGPRHIERRSRALAALALLAPFAWLRALALVLGLARWLARPLRLELSRATVALVATVIATATFTLAAACRHEGEPGLQALDLAALAAATAVWAAAAARPLVSEAPGADATWPTLAAPLVVLALQAGPLSGPIGWFGDEAFHLFRALRARELLATTIGPGLVAGAAALLLTGRRGPAVVIGLVVSSLFAVTAIGPDGNLVFNRYLLLETWLHGLLSFAPGSLGARDLSLDEGWYRLLPLFATAASSAAVARLAPFGPGLRFLAALALAFIPTLVHHATVLYLEVPLALAMLAVLAAHARRREALTEGVALLALLAIPFAKETAAVFSFGLGVRLGLGALAERRPGAFLRWLVLLGVPVALGLYFRLPNFRPYRPDLAPFGTPIVLVHLARALFEQLGLVLLLAPFGAIGACLRGRRDHAALCLGLVLGYAAFIGCDGPTTVLEDGSRVSLWWGNARFSLLFLAPLVALAGEVVVAPWRGRGLVLATALGLSALLWPVAPSGARPPFWGDCLAPSELFYPYDRAIALVPRQSGARVALVGCCADYPFELYRDRLGARFLVERRPWPWDPIRARFRELRGGRWPLPRDLPGDPGHAALRSELEAAASGESDALLVHLLPGDESSWPREQRGYRLEGDLRLGLSRVLVYVRR